MLNIKVCKNAEFCIVKIKKTEMRTERCIIEEKIIGNLLTTCQSKSILIPNFVLLKQETADLRAKTGHNQKNLYQGVNKVTKS